MEVWGYRKHFGKCLVCLASILATGGLLGLVFYWLRHWWVYCTHSPASLQEAEAVLIVVIIFTYYQLPSDHKSDII